MQPTVTPSIQWDSEVLAWSGGEPVLPDSDVARLVAAAVIAGAAAAGHLPASDIDVEVGVSFVAESRMRSLNREHREIDAATDVLAFPIDELGEAGMLPNGMPLQLGDLAVCPAYVAAQVEAGTTMLPHGPGQEQGDSSLVAALERCLVHGALHLCGLDHELGDDAAREMFELEQQVLDLLRRR